MVIPEKVTTFTIPGIKKWQQFWVDSSGGPTLYTGQLINGEMRFDAEKYNPDGTKDYDKNDFL